MILLKYLHAKCNYDDYTVALLSSPGHTKKSFYIVSEQEHLINVVSQKRIGHVITNK